MTPRRGDRIDPWCRSRVSAVTALLASADKLHDFDLCSCVQNRLAPARLLDDPAVQFHGHAGRVESAVAAVIPSTVCPSEVVCGSPLTVISMGMLG